MQMMPVTNRPAPTNVETMPMTLRVWLYAWAGRAAPRKANSTRAASSLRMTRSIPVGLTGWAPVLQASERGAVERRRRRWLLRHRLARTAQLLREIVLFGQPVVH